MLSLDLKTSRTSNNAPISGLHHAARCTLSTLRAVVTFDYARLASGWWLAFAVPDLCRDGFLQNGFSYRLPSIPSSFHGFSLALFKPDPAGATTRTLPRLSGKT